MWICVCGEHLNDLQASCTKCGMVRTQLYARRVPASPSSAETTSPTKAKAQDAAATPPIDSELRGFGGWLWWLLIWQWISLLALLAITDFKFAFRVAPAQTVLQIGWVVLGLIVTMLLPFFTGRPWPIRIGIAYWVATIALTFVVFIYLSDRSLDGAATNGQAISQGLVRSVVYSAIWLRYFAKSKRVRATYYPHLAALPGEIPALIP